MSGRRWQRWQLVSLAAPEVFPPRPAPVLPLSLPARRLSLSRDGLQSHALQTCDSIPQCTALCCSALWSVPRATPLPPDMPTFPIWLKAAQVLNERLAAAAPLDHSKVAGMMTPRVPLKLKPVRSGMRIDESEGSDLSLRGLGSRRSRSLRRKRCACRWAVMSVQTRSAGPSSVQLRSSQFSRSASECVTRMLNADGYCTCRPTCDMAKFVRCPMCKAIKKGKCRVGTCKAASAPLLLTCTGPAPVLAINE